MRLQSSVSTIQETTWPRQDGSNGRGRRLRLATRRPLVHVWCPVRLEGFHQGDRWWHPMGRRAERRGESTKSATLATVTVGQPARTVSHRRHRVPLLPLLLARVPLSANSLGVRTLIVDLIGLTTHQPQGERHDATMGCLQIRRD